MGDVDTSGDDGPPTWSPDGKRIVFSSNRTGAGGLWIMKRRRQRAAAARGPAAPRRPGARRSPDATRIAFHSLDGLGRTQLYRVRPNGSRLTRLGVSGRDATWLPPA